MTVKMKSKNSFEITNFKNFLTINRDDHAEDDHEFLIEFDVVLNRLYINYYKHPIDFWQDIGLIFKNIKKHFPSESSSIRKMGLIF